MIAFVVAVADRARFEVIAQPALARVREADSVILAIPGGRAPQLALNAALDELAGEPDLEAVVVLHEDVVLLDVDTAAIVRRTFGDPEIALAGPIGAHGVRSLAWWHAGVFGVGRVQTPHVPDEVMRCEIRAGAVDALDGIVLCLGPWAVRTLRFAEDLAADFHGYDIELCFQARYHGRRVEVVELEVRHEHRPLFADSDRWVRNELRFRQRWIERRMITERRHRALSAVVAQAPEPAG